MKKKIRVDVYAKSETKNYIIEMQVVENRDIVTRADLSSSRILNNLYKKGDVIELKREKYIQ